MKAVLFAALAVFAAGGTFAEIRAVELSIEARASSIVLPSQPPSSVVVTPCIGCTPVLVPTTVRSQYYVNGAEVGLEELRRALSGRPEAAVVVIYDKKSGELRRLRAFIH